MKINETTHTSIWYDKDQNKIFYIDQTLLPWELKIRELGSLDDTVRAVRNMEVRGAPLIGVTAAFGMWLAAVGGHNIEDAARMLLATRPTAVNLQWAVNKMLEDFHSRGLSADSRVSEKHKIKIKTLNAALEIRDLEISCSKSIGENGLHLIENLAKKKNGKPVNILTHCNAGWLACVEWGTATAPIYMAHDKGIPVHVWVDETRPRNQGAKLTAFELGAHGVPYTLIPDNTGGHLMQEGMVDMVIVGCDRVAANGDVANKIGTYLKALAAKDNNIPFYVAMPYSSYDPDTPTGKDIPIEERDPDEVRIVDGERLTGNGEQGTVNGDRLTGNGERGSLIGVAIVPEGTPVANYGFDITPARLVSGYITEKGLRRDAS